MANTWKLGHRRLRAVLACGAALGFGAVVTHAVFTDQAAFTTSFTVGDVDLLLNGEQGNPDAYTFSTWTAPSMQLGEDVYAPLEVKNDGSLPLTYTITVPTFAPTDSTDLQTTLVAGAKIVEGTCDASTYETSSSIVVPNGPLNAFAVATPRALPAGGSEVLCVMALLPADAPVTIQGGVVTPTVQFLATQQT